MFAIWRLQLGSAVLVYESSDPLKRTHYCQYACCIYYQI